MSETFMDRIERAKEVRRAMQKYRAGKSVSFQWDRFLTPEKQLQALKEALKK